MISNLYPPEILGGAEKTVRDGAERLVERGHEVTVIASTSRDNGSIRKFVRETIDGVNVYRLPLANCYAPIELLEAPAWQKPIQHAIDLWNPQVFYMVSKKIDDLDPTIVHTHNFGGLSPAIFTAAGRKPTPVVHTLHDYRLLDLRPDLFHDGEILGLRSRMKPFRWYNRRVVEPNVDRVLAPSQFMIDKHREGGLFESTACTKLPNGIELTDTRVRIPDPAGEFRLLYVGQLTEAKGIDVLLESFRSWIDEDIRLDVLGKGPLKSRVETAAAEIDAVYYHGFVPEETLHEFYRRAHVTVVPSQWHDNSPTVIYESYARGTPVIAANIGGIPEFVEEGTTGFLFDPEDHDALRDAILTAIDELDRSTFENAVQLAREFTLDSHVDGLLDVYRELS